MDRETKIQQLIESVVTQLNSGEDVQYDQLERSHPNLAPELAVALKNIKHTFPSIIRGKELRKHEDASEIDRVNLLFDDFEVVTLENRGGQGSVYRAFDIKHERTVALKILDSIIASSNQLYRFKQEVKLASRLQHNNIVRVYQSGEIEGSPFIVMEFVEGLPIDDAMSLPGRSVRECVQCMVKVAGAVSYAHERGVIHRDLKPSNILTDVNDEPHILDFGLARDVFAELSHTIDGQVMGTLPYMSPEQAGGGGWRAGVRSDIYTLGVVLFRCITQNFPYPLEGGTGDVLEAIITRAPAKMIDSIIYDDIQHRRGEIDKDLETIVRHALHKNPVERYSSAHEFAEDLQRWLDDKPIRANPDRAFYVLGKTIRRYRRRIFILCAFLLVTVSGVVGTSLMWRRASTQSDAYQHALNSWAYNKLASAKIDEGRVNDGMAILRESIKLGEQSAVTNQAKRMLFGSYHRLSEILLADRQFDEALKLSRKSHELVMAQKRKYGDNFEWLRLEAFALYLNGRIMIALNQLEQAEKYLQKSIQIFSNLLAKDTESQDIKLHLARAHGRMAKCLRELRQYDEALVHATTMFMLRNANFETNSSAPNAIALAFAANSVASCHMQFGDETHAKLALKMLDHAHSVLASIPKHVQQQRSRDIAAIASALEQNRKIIFDKILVAQSG